MLAECSHVARAENHGNLFKRKSVYATGKATTLPKLVAELIISTTSFPRIVYLPLFFRIFSVRFQDRQRTFAPVHR
jgi:hypothetical protein